MARWEFWEGWIGNHDRRIEDATCSNCGYVHPTVRRTLIGNKFKSGETPQDILDKLSDTCPRCGAKMVGRK
jgi:ribosomal protein S27AE